MAITLFDFAIAGIIVVSGLFALVRGFVREALAVIGWVAAIFVTFQLFPFLQPFGRVYIGSTLLADLTTGTLIFLFTLVLFSLLSYAIAMRVRESRIGTLDRSLGFVFGLLRGAVLVCIGYLLANMVWPPKTHPEWVRTARVMPVVQLGSNMLMKLVPPQYRPTEADRRQPESKEPLRPLIAPRPAGESPDKGGETGYKADERKAMERLLRGKEDEPADRLPADKPQAPRQP
jgi:membrane protein required for colicin V production